MCENISRLFFGKKHNTVEVRLSPKVSFGERRRSAAEVSSRFLTSASSLPHEGYLGMELSPVQGGFRLSAFSAESSLVTSEDFSWIFQPVSEAACDASDDHGELILDAGRVYALLGQKEDGASFGGIDDYEDCCTMGADREDLSCAVLAEVEERSGVIRMISFGRDSGVVLLRLPEEMPLRMRAMLSMAFPDTAVHELTEDSVLRDDADVMRTGDGFEKVVSGILSALMVKKQHEAPSEINETPDCPGTGPKSDSKGRTPIEELDLSVRSYNCLKRAGYNYAEEIAGFSVEDFSKVRNLGRRSVEEIKQKLKEFGIVSVPEGAPVLDHMAMLNELIGLGGVKEQIRKIVAFAKMKMEMDALGKGSVPIVLNMEFAGNPGTAKTTVARIVAGIFRDIGLLSNGKLIEVGRSDLVAKYVGHTADNVRSVFERAKGSLLFIDEAYSLIDDLAGSFGDEAINAIVQEMENRRSETIVIFAGYPDKMKKFFSRNPGLRSRVPFRIEFGDYSVDEMVSIAGLEAKKRGFDLSSEAVLKISSACEAAAGDPSKGNGRFCRNLVEKAIIEYASRIYGSECETNESDFILREQDIPLPQLPPAPPPARRIGF